MEASPTPAPTPAGGRVMKPTCFVDIPFSPQEQEVNGIDPFGYRTDENISVYAFYQSVNKQKPVYFLVPNLSKWELMTIEHVELGLGSLIPEESYLICFCQYMYLRVFKDDELIGTIKRTEPIEAQQFLNSLKLKEGV
jgi:hypothetical protein